MSEIVLRDLLKTYPGGKQPATDHIDLEVADGEFVVLVGPSGCGKTTLLRMVAGLEAPDHGTITIGGVDMTTWPARRRRVSMVFQSYAIFPHLRVRQNIGFGLAMRNVPRAEIDRRVREAAELLELDELLDRFPAQLSGGQRQRVAVARAIVVDTTVLLMDEPLSNLDALLRLQFRAELKKLVRQIGTTTLYVTHDQAEALSLGDRIAVMRSGRIAQIGPPMEVYDVPNERFVGGFLGSPPMNFLAASVHSGKLVMGEQTLPAPPELASFGDREVLVGIRAENIAVRDQSGDGSLRATVEVVEPTGAAVLLTVRLDGHLVKVLAPAGFQAEPDLTVLLRPEPAALRFYDPETAVALTTSVGSSGGR